jgi:glycerol 3-phosphatase-2
MRRTRAARRTAGAALAGPIDGVHCRARRCRLGGRRRDPGAAEALNELRARGNQVVFLTNDPRGSRAEYARRLVSLGIDASPDQVVTSGAATADFLATHEGVDGQTAFVIGSRALKAEMQRAGLCLLDIEHGRDADCVVVGGHSHFNYDELRVAAQAVRHGAPFYATNRDAVFPMPDGLWPGTGAVLAAVEAAAGRPAVAIGKPEALIFAAARAHLGDCGHVTMIGDELDADIAGGRRAGLTTILVLTGNASVDDVRTASAKPDLTVASLAALVGTQPPEPPGEDREGGA